MRSHTVNHESAFDYKIVKHTNLPFLHTFKGARVQCGFSLLSKYATNKSVLALCLKACSRSNQEQR